MKLIFDSNIFDKIVDGVFPIKLVTDSSFQFYTTHIQADEINDCSDVERRDRLLSIFKAVNSDKIPTESFVIGSSRIGSAKIGDGILIEKIRGGNLKKTEDALIGETAIKNKLTLVTNDERFRKKVISLGGEAISSDELLPLLK